MHPDDTSRLPPSPPSPPSPQYMPPPLSHKPQPLPQGPPPFPRGHPPPNPPVTHRQSAPQSVAQPQGRPTPTVQVRAPPPPPEEEFSSEDLDEILAQELGKMASTPAEMEITMSEPETKIIKKRKGEAVPPKKKDPRGVKDGKK